MSKVMRFRRRPLAVGIVIAVMLSAAPSGWSFASEPVRPPSAPTPSQPTVAGRTPNPSSVAPKDRNTILGTGWKTSKDRVWATSGDAEGFHVLVAEAATGYAWRTAATLAEPGFDVDSWIGNACLTGSGRRIVVVYAPRTFTNKPELMARGGFTAVVDLVTGDVRKLGLQASLSYYNPGCGAAESAVLTQSGGEDRAGTRLIRLDAATGSLSKPLVLKNQVTSAVPIKGGSIVAADGARLVRIAPSGSRQTLVSTGAVPLRLTPDADGGVVFIDRAGKAGAEVKRVPAAGQGKKPVITVLGEGPLTGIGIARAAGGQVFLTGRISRTGGALPRSVHHLGGTPKDARPSTLGTAVLTKTVWADGKDSRVAGPAAERPAAIDLTVLATGKRASFVVEPGGVTSTRAAKGRERSPALTAPQQSAETGVTSSPTNPVEEERVCSVPRNDPRNQAMQPKPRQVEWAVDQAIMGTLNQHISRPANWKNLGMPAYQPQTLFPRPALVGGGRVPAQVLLGVAAQESNLWQASRHSVPGVTSNPLIGNYYGIDYYPEDGETSDDWGINWAEADCGYGITQVTDRMRLAGKEDGRPAAWPYQTQRAVALDYTANIAAGLQILSDKWNQTQGAGLIVNNGAWSSLENWFFALWAYNSGFYPNRHDGGPWGVGWANNPANPEWDAGRYPFMELSYADAAHPQDWPYQEKVLGFAGHPIESLESPGVLVHGFRAAWWITDGDRVRVKPAESLFCGSVNSCDPGKIGDGAANQPGAGPCTRSDYKCWWNQSVRWKSCPSECGYELVRFDSTYPEQADGTAYAPNCSLQASSDLMSKGNAAPPGALIIDDQPDGMPVVRPGCGRPWTNAGSFSFTFTSDAGTGLYPGKIDTHQIGGGFGGHFYFSHSRRDDAEGRRLKVTGTWTLASSRSEWSRIVVHLPNHGAHSQQARYEIDTGTGMFSKVRYINQKRLANNWVSLGVYRLDGVPRVRLSTLTDDGNGTDDVAWDAVAFQPLPAKPRHFVAVMGDSYTSGEGAEDYFAETDSDHGTNRWNACRRSKNSWARALTLPGIPQPLGQLEDSWSAVAELGNVACSGARTTNVWDGAYDTDQQRYRMGQHHEQKQIRSGVLDENTTLVMLTLGGNDRNAFTDAFIDCAGIYSSCSDDPNFLPTYKGRVDLMIPSLRTTLTQIKSKARNAQIVLMGYPEPFSRTVKCGGSYYFYMPEVAALAQLAAYVNGEQQKLVTSLQSSSVKIAYADPIDKFVGHGGCDEPEWINKVVIGPTGDGDFHPGDPESAACTPEWLGGDCLSRESFHPNAAGTRAYADVMLSRLLELGYFGAG